MMKKGFYCAVVVMVVAMTSSSCALVDGTKRMKDPATIDVIHPKTDGTTISQAVTSDRRIIVFRGDKACPEAPPDTASNISASYSGALDASLKAAAKDAAPDIKASYAEQLATALNHITNPSQGILFMRFAMAAACTAYMNGALNGEQYYEVMNSAMISAVTMTMFEIDKNGGKIGNNVSTVTQTAPTLSGAIVTVAQAQKVATDAATNNAGGAGKPSADTAGKDAGDTVKQKAPADTTVDGLANTSGQAAHDAVLNATNNADKAEKARVEAIQKVFKLASISSARPGTTTMLATAVPFGSASSPAFQKALETATTPLTSLNDRASAEGDAAANAERAGFQALLDRDMQTALTSFDAAYAAYPKYHNVDEIRNLLRLKYAAIQSSDDAQWRAIYSIIVSKYAWRAPGDLIKQMAAKAGM